MIRVLNYGGGTNSTALAVLAVNLGLPLDIIVFADTGSERPETIEYVSMFSAWLVEQGYPPVTVVRWIRVRGDWKGRFIPLHEWCEHFETLPSRAFGLSGCTSKWKQQPVDKHLRAHPLVVAEHLAGRRVERWIGYDADEPSRFERMQRKNPAGDLWAWRAPLVARDLGREECVQLIEGAGLSLPGKSACWLCPAMRKPEIDALSEQHPSLLARALRIESTAIRVGNVRTRKGLGGRLNWSEYVNRRCTAQPQQKMFPSTDIEGACGCFDGGDPCS